MKLNKTLETKLLEKIFAEYTLLGKGESNNGAYYSLQKDDRKVHVKIVDKDREDEEGLDEKALSELASGCDHIANLVSTGELNDRYAYLEFEHIAGKSLLEVKELSFDQLKKLALQMTKAIEYLWSKGIVHRDIKPGNIMLGDDGNFYLVDLGIGYFIETPNRDNTKTKGSRYYSSPEQFFASTDNRVEITFASDLYSLGMVMFEKATGSHPKSTWSSKQNCYGELITQTEPPKIEAKLPSMPTELKIFINKALSIYKSDRFLTAEQATRVLLNEPIANPSVGNVYLHDYGNDYSYIDPYLKNTGELKPDAIVVSLNQGEDRIKTITKLGYEVIVDPLTFRLPHPLAKSDKLKKKLGYKSKAKIDADRISKTQNELITKTLEAQKKSKIFILPYFAIESLDDQFLSINKSIWATGKAKAKEQDEFKKTFGGIVLPASVIKQDLSTDRLINYIHGKYDLDGYYLIFESPDDKATAIDSINYLSNAKKILNAFSSMGEVILANSDLSYLMITDKQSLAFGWSNSKRRFIFDNELYGKSSGFMPKDYDPKVLYYIPQLMTLVKGEEELEALATFSPQGSLDCSCTACESLKPYDGQTPKKLDLAAQHYFHAVVATNHQLKTDTQSARIKLLNDATNLTKEIKRLSRNTVGNKLIPNHEAILSVVND